jgi:hypothetical protein
MAVCPLQVPLAAAYLEADQQDPKKWAGCFRTRAGHGQFTSNAAESTVNWVSEELREAPVLELVEGVLSKIMKTRYDAAAEAAARVGRGLFYTKHAMERFEKERRESLFYSVIPCSAAIFFADRDGVKHKVNMQLETCCCTLPQQFRHACRHMIAVMNFKKEAISFPSTKLFNVG